MKNVWNTLLTWYIRCLKVGDMLTTRIYKWEELVETSNISTIIYIIIFIFFALGAFSFSDQHQPSTFFQVFMETSHGRGLDGRIENEYLQCTLFISFDLVVKMNYVFGIWITIRQTNLRNMNMVRISNCEIRALSSIVLWMRIRYHHLHKEIKVIAMFFWRIFLVLIAGFCLDSEIFIKFFQILLIY